jgi:hypothetical protein
MRYSWRMPKQLHLRLDSDDAPEVRRFDLAKFSPRTTLTPQGFLRAPAAFTRAGVFTYHRADGTAVRELRPVEEVFSKDSTASLSGAPLVIDHPKEGWVTSANAKRLAVGWGSEQVERQDMILAGTVTIHDQAAIDRVGKDLKEISLGYTCRIDKTSGTDPVFGPYDQIQRGIRYNHAALGPDGWGRAGPTVGLRLDSEDAQYLDPTLTPDRDPNDTGGVTGARKDAQEKIVNKEKITIGGVEFEVEAQVAQALRADRKTQADLVKEHEGLKGRFDAQTEKLKDTEKKLAEAQDAKRFDAAVDARVALVSSARRVLGEEAKITGSARAIMEQVLKHDRKDPPSFEGKSDDYVQSRFDSLIEDLPAKKAEDSKRAARKDAHDAQTGKDKPVDRYDSKAARERMLEANRKAAEGPLTI